jgi:CRP/FNR family transcriptional regulator, cyclic AMP receptor protein
VRASGYVAAVTTASRSIEDVLTGTTLLAVAAPQTIGRLARTSRRRTVERGDVLFVAGERATAIYIVDTGTFRVFNSSAQGTEPTLALVHEGEIIGELGVLDDLPRSASIAALRRAEIVEIPAASFREAYGSDPAISRQLVVLLGARLRAVTDGLADLAYLDLGGRLAKYLLAESARHEQLAFRLTLTQAELGQLLGGARQSVNQVVRSFEQSGLISLDGRTVRILDERGLRLRAMSSGGRFE